MKTSKATDAQAKKMLLCTFSQIFTDYLSLAHQFIT